MKQLKWTTVQEWVDKDTGELITKDLANKEYIIIKKISTNEYDKRYVPKPYGGYILTEFGTKRITNLCTRNGKQQKLF